MLPRTRVVPLLWLCALPALAQVADMGVLKTGPATAAAGADVPYTLTVFNAGPDPAAAATLSDPIPAGMTFVSIAQSSGPAFSCSTPSVGAGGTVTCSNASFAGGVSAVFTLTLRIAPATPGGTTFTNIASVASATPDLSDENDTGAAATMVPLPAADLAVLLSAPASAAPNTDLAYTISLANSGPGAATGVSLGDTLPAGLTFVSLSAPPGFSCSTPAVGAGGAISCTTATIAAGFSGAFVLTAHIPGSAPSGTTFDNSAAVTSDFDLVPENDAAAASTTISAADVSVTVTGASSTSTGADVDYTITVANAGPDPASAASFGLVLPAGVTFVSLTQNSGPAFVCSAPGPGGTGTVGCVDYSLLFPGASAHFTLRVHVSLSAADSTLAETVTASTSSFDPNFGNNAASAATSVAPAADLTVTVSAASAVPGTNATFTIAVSNSGPSAASGVTLTVGVPAGLTFVSVSQSAGPAFTCSPPSGGSIVCSGAALNASASATFAAVFAVPASVTIGSSIPLTAVVATSTQDPVVSNNSASGSLTVSPIPVIPVVSPATFLALATLLGGLGAAALRRRVSA